ncbi:hypothetical protein H4N58_08975 [Mumia sp. ZJ1417]|uniref:hypothetical protein n=1 Tax=Mumia sp. ZJ1417 TaxID=2708082 RepID=UPI0014209ACB|nr:hypothetical protein [Mumia sp. ZJ1417]QMW67955.1 hypothetical protein H4N58_08975 [Mumia sp. ZJ1417]
MNTRERTVEVAPGWRVILPAGWISLPTDPEQAPRAITGLVDAALEGKPRDELITTRIEIERTLRGQCDQAHRQGARYLHSLFEPIAGALVSASLVATEFVVEDTDSLANTLLMDFREGDAAVDVGFVDVGEHGALRRVREEVATDLFPDQPQPVNTLSVDFVVRLDATHFGLLTFATTTMPLRDELVLLFDAIAATLHPIPASTSTAS